ncbi:hypothetical protein NQP46_01715 [Streptomyces albus]|nr:hypothetical protein NQP46_01715 [Streptomyces albus]
MRLFLGATDVAGLYDTEYLAGLERRRPWLSVVPVTGGEGYGRLAAAVTRAAAPSGAGCCFRGRPRWSGPWGGALARAGVAGEDVRHDLLPTGAEFGHASTGAAPA